MAQAPTSCEERDSRDGKCVRPCEPGRKYCYFHLGGEKDPDEFYRRFTEDVAQRSQDRRPLDYSHCTFPRIDFSRIDFTSAFIAKDATFNGEVICARSEHAHQLNFEGSTFKKQLYLHSSEFREGVYLRRCVFEGNVVLSDVVFHARAFFERSVFKQLVVAVRTEFRESAFFSHSRFTLRADLTVEIAPIRFHEARFHKEADFEGAIFRPVVSFLEAEFEGELRLIRTHFGSFTSFHRASINRAVIRECMLRQGSFSEARFKGNAVIEDCFRPRGDAGLWLDFSRIHVERRDGLHFVGLGRISQKTKLDMRNVALSLGDVGQLRFSDVIWERNTKPARKWIESVLDLDVAKGYAIFDELHGVGVPAKLPLSLRYHPPGKPIVATVYKGLRESYERSLRYEEAGLFHVREMQLREEIANSRGATLHKKNRLLLRAYRIASLYGESWRRPLLWSFATIVVFGLIAWGFELARGEDGYPILHSALVFFQVGSAVIDFIDILERVIGLLLLALLALAVKRQFKR